MSTSLTSTTGAAFNPAITSKKIIDIREANLGFEGTVSTQYLDEAGVGTTIAWPVITAFSAAAKSEGNSGNDITFTGNTESSVTLTINQHQYAAFELEEFEAGLSLHDQEEIYTRRAAYAVNLAVDDTLAALVTALKGHHALVADMSDARRLFHLTGPDAALRDTLARLCPVDMRAFQLGEIRRTRLAQIAAAFWMGEEGRLDLICFRSVAQYAEDLLSDAAGKGVVLR